MQLDPTTSADFYYICIHNKGFPLFSFSGVASGPGENRILLLENSTTQTPDMYVTSRFIVWHTHPELSEIQSKIKSINIEEVINLITQVQWDINQYEHELPSSPLLPPSRATAIQVKVLTKEKAKDQTLLFILQKRFEELNKLSFNS